MDVVKLLKEAGIKPSAHRVAVAEHVLCTDAHPSADQVWKAVRQKFPVISRATVYNTLNCFVEKGILRALQIAEGRVVFDPKLEKHHHFLDEHTGRIHDVPWEALEVRNVESLKDFAVKDYQVVLTGRRKR
ncbi:MAG: Fur family transcriptional regulator [Myxococcaceae bacterium]